MAAAREPYPLLGNQMPPFTDTSSIPEPERESLFIHDALQASPELGGVDIVSSILWIKKQIIKMTF